MLLDELTDVDNFTIKLTKKYDNCIRVYFVTKYYVTCERDSGNFMYVTDDKQSEATLGSRFLIKNILYV